jgi:hypothetical protein
MFPPGVKSIDYVERASSALTSGYGLRATGYGQRRIHLAVACRLSPVAFFLTAPFSRIKVATNRNYAPIRVTPSAQALN